MNFARIVWSAGLLWLAALPLAAQQWQVQFFYDKAKSQFAITDLKFPSATRGVAVGVIVEGKHQDPVSYVTADGGAHWSQIKLEEPPVSLFFLNENSGWLVTTKGLWHTDEAGRNWKRLPSPHAPLLRVCFADENTGWAVGPKKTILETHDGGQHWSKLSIAAETPGEMNSSAYTWVGFATPRFGLITGWSIPPRNLQRPEWVDPGAAIRTREPAHLSYSLITEDGGKTWKASSASLYGTVSRMVLRNNGTGMGLMEYGQGFRYPSEAYVINWNAGTNHSVYRNERFSITDIWLTASGTAYLAGDLVPGQLRSVVPGKVQVLVSHDLQKWEPMKVDYRAEATRVLLAAPDDENLWIATDTGMILKLVK